MVDIQALPIAIALTLWDAAPIFLSVGLALAVLARVTLQRQAFHTVWRLREVAGLEGILYAFLFQPVLVPVLLIVAICSSVLALRTTVDSTIETPHSPGRAVSIRAGELFAALLYGAVLAGLVKIAAPTLPENLMFLSLIGAVTGLIVGSRSGAAAIPAVAIGVHAGGVLPAILCVAATLITPIVSAIRGERRSPASKTR